MIFYPLMLLGSVIFIDICLSGDNALAIAMAAMALRPEHRDKAIYAGMGFAAILRATLALMASTLLHLYFIGFLGGLALLWVAYRLVRDMVQDAPPQLPDSLGRALLTIAIADVSMSLDNVLAVAAIARDHPVIMTIGIFGSIAMLVSATRKAASLLQKHKWLNWIGVLLLIWVAIDLMSGSYDATMSVIRN